MMIATEFRFLPGFHAGHAGALTGFPVFGIA